MGHTRCLIEPLCNQCTVGRRSSGMPVGGGCCRRHWPSTCTVLQQHRASLGHLCMQCQSATPLPVLWCVCCLLRTCCCAINNNNDAQGEAQEKKQHVTCIPMYYAPHISGRVVAGLGCGAASLFVPRYIAEVAPPDVRGALGTMTQVLGGLLTGCLCAWVCWYLCVLVYRCIGVW